MKKTTKILIFYIGWHIAYRYIYMHTRRSKKNWLDFIGTKSTIAYRKIQVQFLQIGR